ncbi:asparagine synthase (glutamine-hydrolyzing) [Nocardia sp. NPDC051990]|uniref:asparagine synthase (glutamine-hydrolyzing) n=1 Tax=Nocardia sp. NPDC051990 TaxID=3155285 RepID=UPI00341D4789
MCRIHGYLGGAPVEQAALTAVAQAQRHGGPDAQTMHVGAGWALGSNRLAVQGVDHGRQPYRFGPGLMCVFNGEIYNHVALRGQLAGDGFRFEGTCDGDVVLPLYERYGNEFVAHLEGMFAIAIVDSRRGEPILKLFNDHAGMKSLHYYVSGGRLCFASELQALSRFPDFPTQLDRLAVDRYFGGKAVWGPETIFSQVRTMPPGSIVEFGSDARLVETSFAMTTAPFTPDADPAETLEGLLRAEMRKMLAADVPVCAITSGGLDSSLLTAVATELAGQVDTFNVAYRGEWPADERHFAAQVAAHCGTRHHQVELDPREFPALIDEFVAHLDQPNNAPHSLSTFGLFKAVHEAGFKVAITGDGADELFAGYRRYLTAAADTRPGWHRRYQTTLAIAPVSVLAGLYSDAFRNEILSGGGYFSDLVGDEVAADRDFGERGVLETLLHFDCVRRFPEYILRRLDNLSMAWAVEARVPFLQPRIMAFASQLPARAKTAGGTGKAPVAAVARGRLPACIVDRDKQPFTLPITAMMRPGQPLYDMVGDIVLPVERSGNLFNAVEVKSLFARQTARPANQTAQLLWSILILERWLAVRGLQL